MKKVLPIIYVIALVLALVCVLGLVGCSDKNITFDIGTANKINIKSGLTGDEVNIADNEFIQSITENINSLRFEKTSKVNEKVGYAYMLTWFDTEDNQIARITITEENGYQISHDGYYYKVGADLSIDTELIDEMLNIALSSAPAPTNWAMDRELNYEPIIYYDIDGKAEYVKPTE